MVQDDFCNTGSCAILPRTSTEAARQGCQTASAIATQSPSTAVEVQGVAASAVTVEEANAARASGGASGKSDGESSALLLLDVDDRITEFLDAEGVNVECVTDRFYANSNHAAMRRRRIQMLRQPNKTSTVAGANDVATATVNVT